MGARAMAALFIVGTVGCQHGFDGPKPAIAKVAPAVVCNALDTTVTLTGTGFTPVPEQVLANQSTLVLPTVTLVDAQGTARDIDDADVHWTNEATMSFVARASLALAPGVYDVVVTNPTGKQGRAEKALTVVPPPTLTSVVPDAVCHDLSTVVTLTGSNFRSDPTAGPLTVIIGTPTPTVLSEADGAVVFVSDTSARATVPTGLPDGIYDVTIKNADGCEATLPMALRIVPPPTITMIDPPTVWNGAAATITIHGMNFRMTPTVSIAAAGGAAIPLAAGFVDAQTVTAIVPMGTAPGSYTLTLTNPDGCAATAMLTVTNLQPITVTGVINPFGCSSQNTAITISGTFFQSTPQAVLVGAAAGGADLKLRNVAFVSATRLTALVPAGGVIGGAYPLRVTNPDGGAATLANAFTITKLCPPTIDNVDPNSVVHNYNSKAPGSSAITLRGNNFRADAQVVLVSTAGMEVMFPGAMVTVVSPAELTLDFNAGASNLTDGIYLVRVKEADDSVANGGTGAVMFGDFSLFIVTNPSGKFQSAQMARALPSGRRGLGVVGGQINAAARFIYAIAGDGGGANPAPLADGLYAALDVFGRIGDLGWQLLRKRDPSSAMPPADTANALPSARTGVALAEHNRWIYVVGGTIAVGSGPAPTPSPGGPLAEVLRAHILSASDAPVLAQSTPPGGTLAAGTWYYKVSILTAAGTVGYGAAAAETVASDEEVVTVTAGQSTRLDFALPTSLSFVAGQVAGYRVYRSPAANGVSQSEIWLADTPDGFFVDDGSRTPAGAHPLAAGMLSPWEPSGATLATTRAYPSLTLAFPSPSPTPSPSPEPNLYVVGGWSTGALALTELAPIHADGSLGSFGSTGAAMTAPRWSGFASTVTGPPSVTSETWIIAGAGATSGGNAIQERARVKADGTLEAWAPIPTGPGGDFTTMSTTLGPIGFYSNGHIAIVDGWTGTNVQNKDEFGTEACNVGGAPPAICPAGTDFKQTAKSSSTLGVTPPVAWCGYTITSGYVFIVGGSSDGTNAIATVQQGAQ